MAILSSHTHSSRDTRNLISKKKQRMNLDEPTHLIKNQDEQKKEEPKSKFHLTNVAWYDLEKWVRLQFEV